MTITSGLHSDSIGYNNHVPHVWEYADEAARLAATGFGPADVGKWCLQLDTDEFYRLTDDDPETWVLVGGGGGGAPTTEEYVTTAASGTLSNEVAIPGLAASADILGQGGGGAVSEEYDTATPGLTWDVAPTVVDSDTTIKSHLYICATANGTHHGLRAWSPAGAFDIRTKVGIGHGGTRTGNIGILLTDNDSSDMVLLSLNYNSNNFCMGCFTFTGASWTARNTATNWIRYSTVDYLRITRDGANNITFYDSPDGILWQQIATCSFTFTVAKCGYRLQGNNPVYFHSDFLRANV